MATPPITMAMKIITMITMATTTTTTAVATKIPITAMMMATLSEEEEEEEGVGEVPPPHLGAGGHHPREVELVIPKGGHPWDRPEERGGGEGALRSSSEAAAPAGPGATAGATWEARERRMGTTSPTPSAVRPTTSRTGAPNPSRSSRSSKVVTMRVTMVTIMTTRSFIRIRTGSSGSRQVRRDLRGLET